MKEHFLKALLNLKNMIAEIAVMAEEAVYRAIKAAKDNNTAEAQKVISNDAVINDFEIKIEEECLKILALYQPVAGDLRQVITCLKVNNEIERVGDLAVNIAERVSGIAAYQNCDIEKMDFSDMVGKACGMLEKSLDALAYHDVMLAAEVIGLDDAVDDLHRDNYDKVGAMILKYPEEGSYYMGCLTISRCLERIADIATNICEDVIYLEHGKIVRHAHDGEK